MNGTFTVCGVILPNGDPTEGGEYTYMYNVHVRKQALKSQVQPISRKAVLNV